MLVTNNPTEKDRQTLKEIIETIVGGEVKPLETFRQYGDVHHQYRCEGKNGWAVYAGAKFDDNGRIKYLSMNMLRHIGRTSRHGFYLPDDIGKLEKLEKLILHNCKSLPNRGLSGHRNLKKLVLNNCKTIFNDNSLTDIRLPQLDHVIIYTEKFDHTRMPIIFSWIHQNLPRLESLFVKGRGKRGISTWDPPLLKDTGKIHNNLKQIQVMNMGIDESHLESLLFDVLPSFPKISNLILDGKEISNLQSIHKRLTNTPDLVPKPKQLLDLQLHLNKLVFKDQTKELCAILRAFNVFIPLTSINYGIIRLPPVDHDQDYHPDVKHELLLNKAGRSFIASNRDLLPLSIWPTILARVDRVEENDTRFDRADAAAGMYSILRHEITFLYERNADPKAKSKRKQSPECPRPKRIPEGAFLFYDIPK